MSGEYNSVCGPHLWLHSRLWTSSELHLMLRQEGPACPVPAKEVTVWARGGRQLLSVNKLELCPGCVRTVAAILLYIAGVASRPL